MARRWWHRPTLRERFWCSMCRAGVAESWSSPLPSAKWPLTPCFLRTGVRLGSGEGHEPNRDSRYAHVERGRAHHGQQPQTAAADRVFTGRRHSLCDEQQQDGPHGGPCNAGHAMPGMDAAGALVIVNIRTREVEKAIPLGKNLTGMGMRAAPVTCTQTFRSWPHARSCRRLDRGGAPSPTRRECPRCRSPARSHHSP